MKHKSLLTALLLLPVFTLKAQSPSVLVYYMPKTMIELDVHYTVTTEEQGIFYQYSQRYLGTDKAVSANSTTYTLDEVKLHRKTIADTARCYTIDLTAYPLENMTVSLNSKGILEGINIEQPTHREPQTGHKKDPMPKPAFNKSKEQTAIPPYMEEQLMAGSIAKMAEMTAKQIYRIRETRMNILAGDVDHVPADGEAMKLVLRELNKQEEALTALFLGTRKTRHLNQTVLIDSVADTEHQVIFRFSQFAGIVAKDDLSGEPVYIDLQTQPMTIVSTRYEVPKKQALMSPFYFNQPGSAKVQLRYQNKTLLDKVITVAQLGTVQPLPQSWFDKNAETKIWFDTKTGAIKRIAQ